LTELPSNNDHSNKSIVEQQNGHNNINKESQLLHYNQLLKKRPLDDENIIIEGCKTLLWLFLNGHIDRKIFLTGVKELDIS